MPIKLGDKALDGSQLRPYVVYMDEYLSSLEVPIYEIQTADIFVIVGTSMSIGAGAILAHKAEPSTVKYIIDPADHTFQLFPDFHWIQAPATKGMKALLEWEKIRLKLEKEMSEIPT